MERKEEFSKEEELKAENEVLKLKLEMEHGMHNSETGNLSPQVENEWLNYISNFEKMHQDAKQVKLYEFIGSPVYKKLDELDTREIGSELEKLFDAMAQNGISLGFLCEYDDVLIYKFITEEFFEQEIEDIRIEGMVSNFTYEEFHPNHEYDLERDARAIVGDILKGEWKEEFMKFEFSEPFKFNDKDYDFHGISEIILAYQQVNKSMDLECCELKELKFNLEEGWGTVAMDISYTSQGVSGKNLRYSGAAHIRFSYDGTYWSCDGFGLPGLSA